MATRVNKKQAIASRDKDQTVLPVSTKTDLPSENSPKLSPTKKRGPKNAGVAKKLASKNPPKKVLNRANVKIKLKTKTKKQVKINQKLAKAILQNAKTLEKKKLLKNGIKDIKSKHTKKTAKQVVESGPPVLEPIFPQEENLAKKQPKKRGPKKTSKLAESNLRKVKPEPIDDAVSVASDITDVSSSETPRTKRSRQRKTKTDNETIEDVMNDLSFLIKAEDEIKKEPDSMSESGKSDSSRLKKITKKQRIELLKEKIIKKENIENTLAKLDSADQKVIDMLDLNVGKIKKQPVKRRHSIEKFPMGSKDSYLSTNPFFGSYPRSMSPKTSRKIQKRPVSIDKRSSPYTRSDSPAALVLRSGKRRKLKDTNLLNGLEGKGSKKSMLQLSATDSFSKTSEYDSDSNFSDMSSVQGEKDNSTKTFLSYDLEEKPRIECDNSKTEENSAPKKVIDTNSNVCSDVKPDITEHIETCIKSSKEANIVENKDSSALLLPSPITIEKVPEKSIILDIMKQTFNEETDKEKSNQNFPSNIDATTFYGKTSTVPLSKLETSMTQEVVEPTCIEQAEITQNRTNNVDITTAAMELLEDACKENVEQEKIEDIRTPEFGCEEKECEEEKSLESIVQGCIDSISEMPTLEEMENVTKVSEEALPIIEKMSEQPVTNIPEENMDISEPPQLESCNAELDKQLVDAKTDTTTEQNLEMVQQPLNVEETKAGNCDTEASEVTLEMEEIKENEKPEEQQTIKESPEELKRKESILQALGLQSLKAMEEAKIQRFKSRASTSRSEGYTGTLKTVIKLNRDKKKGKNSLKMTLQKNRSKSNSDHGGGEGYKIMKEGSSTSKQSKEKDSSDIAGAHRKTHYSNRSNLEVTTEHVSDGEVGSQEPEKALVIPEKASSFSIHPGRLCKDECSYCFGKFGLFDTPCHIAQMKSVERQNKILATEKHLTRDSCLCDACYRHVDRKSNSPSYSNKSLKRNAMVAPGPRQNHCHVLGCSNVSTNVLRRKWLMKMKKSICQVINIDLDNPGLHSIPICDQHYTALEHLMICAMCKRRLARNHIHYLGPEVQDLNKALKDDDIPIALMDKPVVCKLCKCFASIILKDPEERPENSTNFFSEYKRRLLHFNDIIPMDASAAEEPITMPVKTEKVADKDLASNINKKRKRDGKPQVPIEPDLPPESKAETKNEETVAEPTRETATESPEEKAPSEAVENTQNSQTEIIQEVSEEVEVSVDYNALVPAIAMDIPGETMEGKETKKKSLGSNAKSLPNLESIRDVVEVSKNLTSPENNSKNCEIAVQRLGSNPSISVRQLFPGEEELPVLGHIDFNNVKEKTPEGWEKCVTTIQYDEETKQLWQELQKPYGNQSSFLRHLVLLEKYFRNGDLILSPNASHHAINYRESVTNRLRAYDNIPTNAGNIQPISMIPFNKMQKSSSGIITSLKNSGPVPVSQMPATNSKNAPITLQQLSSPPLIPANSVFNQLPKPKNPPGLMPLHPGMVRSIIPPQLKPHPAGQKIKFPITKHWRPNLIPIDPTKKNERKPGLVQVISSGKPFHITLEDYKKMCAIKRSFEAKAKQKKLQEAQQQKPIFVTHNSVLKSITPRKGLVISKTSTVTSQDMKLPNHQSNIEEISETILDKLDKQIEKIGQEQKQDKSAVLLPKIPKSLTVIPQTVRKLRPTSPVVMISQRNTNS